MELEGLEGLGFYEAGIFITWIVFAAFSTLSILFRIIKLFLLYITTGKFGDFHDSCAAYNILDGSKSDIVPALLFGTHPGSITFDTVVYAVIIFMAGVAWLPLSVILPLMGLAYFIRQPIARKQEFISKLDGTHEEDNSMSDEKGQAQTITHSSGP